MTQAIYRLDVYDTAGVQRYQLTGQAEGGYLAQSYVKTVNAPGLLLVELAGDHPLLDEIAVNWQIEVWRKPDDGTWGRELTTLFRKWDWEYADQSRATLTCPGLMNILDWRVINYHADTTNRTRFLAQSAETIANTLVKYNATTSGTTGDGRLRAAAGGYPFTGLSVEADGADGNTLSIYCAYKNLLAQLQSIAEIGGGDFDVVKTSATTWQFRWYTGQLGTDKSATLVFSMERGNMAEPHFSQDSLNVKTVATVAGQGEGSDRETANVQHTAYSVTNDIELFVDARDVEAGQTAALTSRGNQKLLDYERIERFDFRTVQVPNARYGIDYVLGDLVKGINTRTGTAYTVKVQSVAVSEDRDGTDTIETEMKL